jgi:hypothetical protein
LASNNDDDKLQEVKEGSKYLATVSGVMLGGYFALFSVGDLKQGLAPWQSWPLFLPIVFWAATLIISVLVTIPYPQESKWKAGSPASKKKLEKWEAGLRRLWWASTIVFLVGMLCMIGALVYYLFYV